MRWGVLAALAICGATGGAYAQSPAGRAIPVTADNFNRGEPDMYFGGAAKRGALGKFFHYRELPVESTVVRPNRDTLYSEAVFDLDAGPVKITMPNAGKRFMSVMAMNEDHYIYEVNYTPGNYTFTRPEVGTRYLFIGLRTLVDPADPNDMKQAQSLQDAVKVSQKSPGKFEVPNWDQATQKKVRDSLIALNSTLPDLRRAFGSRVQVDPVRHLIATAAAWGGNPDKDATYLNITPEKNDGITVYKLNVRDVPVNGFWSVSLYDEKGYYEKNPYNAYSINNITAQKGTDGSIAIQFGGCDGKLP